MNRARARKGRPRARNGREKKIRGKKGSGGSSENKKRGSDVRERRSSEGRKQPQLHSERCRLLEKLS